MSAALQKLDFVVGLIDQVSGPAGKMMRTMDTVTSSIQTGYQKIAYGAAGVVGSVYALDRLITPAKELDRALGELSSLDVANDGLYKLTQSALEFSTQYGESAVDFVSSSYDIQSAISGLVGNDLATFTTASNILAKGTKADAGTITSYMGTMYGIFKNHAALIGKGAWVEQLAGQTAAAVQMYKTTGANMSAAFTSTGASATTHGIAMSEQIAILGELQATMSGSEAGTKYKAFLAGVGKAQEHLGLQFTDSHGKMLPMVEILGLIQSKYGAIDTVAESDLLQKAFGRKEAVDLIKLLSTDVAGLNKNIGLIGQNKGMDKAIAMANAIKDPFEVAGAQMEAIQIVLGKAMIPTLLPLLDTLGDGANTILRWTNLFPHLTKWVGVGVLSIIGLIAGFSLLSIAVGVNKFVMAGWGVVFGTLRLLFVATKFSLLTLIPVVWGFTAALLSNPITWMVLGVVALVAAVAAAIIYWDEWTTAVINFGSKLANDIGLTAFVDSALLKFNKMKSWWDTFKNWLGSLDPFAFVGTSLDWVMAKINAIPGVDIGSSPQPPKPLAAPAAFSANSSASGGGVLTKIMNANGANNSRSIGDVNIFNSGTAMSGQTLMDELEFKAG